MTSQNFHPYGCLIHYPNKAQKGKKRNLFRIVLSENQSKGWRIAYLIVRDQSIKKLECHPHSYESFEPVIGKSWLYVARKKDPKAIKCFYLDRPIILNKGIWHGVVTKTFESEIKLTENAKVGCVYWSLGFRLGYFSSK